MTTITTITEHPSGDITAAEIPVTGPVPVRIFTDGKKETGTG